MSKYTFFNFFPYQWTFEDELNDNNVLTSVIRAYGWNEKNESIYLSIADFSIPMWIELPEHIEWTDSRLTRLCDFLKNLQKQKGYAPVSINYVNKQKLYYANIEKNKDGKYINKKYPFLEVTFRSNKALSGFVYTIKRGINVPNIENNLILKPHASEPSITPVLKLFAYKNLPASSWIRCKGIIIPEDERESTRKYEYTVSYRNMETISEEEANKMPIVYPKILSFDNEAYSAVDGSMPKAEKNSDKVFMIGATFIENIFGEEGLVPRTGRKLLNIFYILMNKINILSIKLKI